MAGMTLWNFYFQVHPGSNKSQQVVEFLRVLRRHLRVPLLVLWDGAAIHRSQAIKDFIADTKGQLAVEPLPADAPELNLTNWQQLKTLSQRDRQLILKISGFSEKAWGARGVYLGSDLSHADWSAAVDRAISSFATSPFVLQRFEKPKLVEMEWFDFGKNELVPMKGRARLCPYYFVSGEGDAARPQLGGVLATIVPADKKIVHGMAEAILAPCGCELAKSDRAA